MAALSISPRPRPRPFSPAEVRSTQSTGDRSCRKALFLLRCHSRDPSDPSEAEKNKEEKQLQRNIALGFEKMGKGLKENLNLSPQRKGDWKDITLMSLSFAVYVYISQKIVCAYCVWVSFPKQHW